MMDLATINYLSEQAARRSRRDGVLPVPISLSALNTAASLSALREEGVVIPFIGNRKPRGFKPLGEPLFCDISGWGKSDEPALTFEQTFNQMKSLTEEHGTLAWATVEQGQFQAYLQPFKIKG